MSIDISVPGGNPNKPGFSVQRSDHGLSISAGALASTNTMFGMANDEGGLSVSAWPVARSTNLIRNPRFHANETDGWYYGPTHVRDASPPVALPAGFDACVHITMTGVGWWAPMTALDMAGERSGVPVVGAGTCSMSFFAYTPPPPSESTTTRCQLGLTFFDSGYSYLDTGDPSGIWVLPASEDSSAAFHEYVAEGLAIPAGAAYCIPEFIFPSYGVDETRHVYITGVMFNDGAATFGGYRDGDVAGWAWDDVAHNSFSRQSA